MSTRYEKWHLTFSDAPEMQAVFGTEIRPVISRGTDDYALLKNKPSINGVELTGNKTDEEIGIEPISNVELEKLLN